MVLIAIQYSSFAQLQRANRNYELYRYSKAIPQYQKAIKNGKEDQRNEAIVKLADCYRMLNNAEEAKSWYSRAVENASAAPINYFYLGKALCQLELYKEAKKAFDKYAELVPDDGRGKKYSGFCDWALENYDAISKEMEIKNEKSLNTKWSDFSPAIYKDGIVFTSDRVTNYKTDLNYKWTDNDYLDLYFSKPKYYKDFWSEMATPVTFTKKFNQLYHDGPIVFSNDGKKVVISRTERKKVKKQKDKIKTHVVKLYYADIEEKKSPKFKPFFLNSDEYSVAHPQLTSDGKTMIFSSDKSGGKGNSDLYMCTFENNEWTNVVNLFDINSEGDEVFPCLINDTVLLFASDGYPGFGGLDIFICNKADGKWSEPRNVMKPMNSSHDDFGILMFSDLKNGYFSSNRPDGMGLDDIYAFRNFEIAKPGDKAKTDDKNKTILAGYVKDKNTLKPIEKATVFLFNPQNGKVKILKTDPDGLYKTTVDRPADYLVKAMQTNYIADCLPWEIAAIEPGKTMNAPRDLLLDKLDLNKTFVIKNIYYDFDKYFIRDDAKPELNKIIKIMQDNPNIIAELSSHTDCRASFAYNDKLSQNRANAAVDYIVTNGGIMPGRLLARGYGEYKLTNKCSDGVFCSEEDHQLNRRTEFKVIGYNQPSTRGQFDPTKFIDGEEVDIKTLPDYFFEPCDLEVKPSKDNNTDASYNQYNKPNQVIISQPTYHTVLSGETLTSIALKYNTSVENLKSINGLSDDKIFAGKKLKISNGGSYDSKVYPNVSKTLPLYHTVVAGETLTSIAEKYKISVQLLRVLNKMTDDKIYTGQKLNLQ